MISIGTGHIIHIGLIMGLIHTGVLLDITITGTIGIDLTTLINGINPTYGILEEVDLT